MADTPRTRGRFVQFQIYLPVRDDDSYYPRIWVPRIWALDERGQIWWRFLDRSLSPTGWQEFE